MLRPTTLGFMLFFATQAQASLEAGAAPSHLELSQENGGHLDGQPWSSDMIKGKVWALFYVDPDERNANESMESALAHENFPPEKFGSIAVINMEATWLPNSVLSSSLKSKQQKFPRVIYVKDAAKKMVKDWNLKDDAYVTIIFDKLGRVLWTKEGKLTSKDTKNLIEVIRSHLNDPAA